MADQDAAQAFRKIVTRHSSQTVDNAGLVNVAFFVGAGFSKTWDSTSPTGNELFTFPKAFLEEIETILDNVGERGALRNTYRGITPALINGKRNNNVVQDRWSVNSLIKINGGFEIVPGTNGYDIDYRKRSFEQVRANAPEIMMPSKEQNYINPYFSSIFPKAVRLLQESDVLVIVGYSLSEEDALLRFLIRQFAEDLRDVHGKSIFYIDYTDQNLLEERLQGCFRYINRMDVNNIFTYSGGFVEWIEKILKGE